MTRAGQTWFDVATMVGDRLVPQYADWVALHVRDSVLAAVRAGGLDSLSGVAAPRDGEGLSVLTLRHANPDAEVALHRLLLALAPRVGDPFGAGRVTATGVSRLASQVDAGHLRAISRHEAERDVLARLQLGSAVIAPVVARECPLGALSLVYAHRGALGGEDLARAERYGQLIGAALDSSVPATAELRTPRSTGYRVWRPSEQDNPAGAARRWVRRTLPEVVHRAVRPGLADDLDLVVSELAGNAIRHAGALDEVRIGQRSAAVRVAVADRDDRRPTVRMPARTSESGRGMLIVDTLAEGWGVEHRSPEGGKLVWAEIPL